MDIPKKFDDDLVKVGKKSKSSPPTKSKHKHRYTPCVFRFPRQWYLKEHLRSAELFAVLGEYCPICGRVKQVDWFGDGSLFSDEPSDACKVQLDASTRTLMLFDLDMPFQKFIPGFNEVCM